MHDEAAVAGKGFDPSTFVDMASKDGGEYAIKDDDRGVIAEFSLQPILLGFKSQQAGREIWDDRIFITIRVRGNDKMEIVREATDADKRRFPDQWKAYQSGASQAKTGTPIERLPGCSPAMCKTLKHLDIRTIEDLSEVGDHILPNLGPGARDLRLRAMTYLANGRAANDETLAKVAALEQTVKEQGALIARAEEVMRKQVETIELLRQKPGKSGKPKKVKH